MPQLRLPSLLPVFSAGLLLGLALPVISHPAGSTVTNLLHVGLAAQFVPDRDVLVDLVEIAPNQKLEWHSHPGEEFHYYLAGDPVIERRDASPIVGRPGTVGHVRYREVHQATAGPQGAKIVVFRVHTRGAPWRYPEAQAPAPPLQGTPRPLTSGQVLGTHPVLTISTEISTAGIVPRFSSQCLVFRSSGQPGPGP